MPANFRNKRLYAYSLLLINSVLWGFSPPIIKYSLQFITPTTFLFFRYLLATLLYFPIFLIYKNSNHHKINVKHHLSIALLGTPLTLLPLFYGLSITNSIDSSILESSSPIFVILGGLVYLKEKVTPKEWLGTIIALSGSLFLISQPAISSGTNNQTILGNLLIVLSNIIWASFLLLSKKDHTDPVYLSFFSYLLSVPFFLFVSLISNNHLSLHPLSMPGVFYMAVFGSITAFWAYQKAQQYVEASEAAIFSYLKPVFTIPLAYYWLHESFTKQDLIAIALILLGVYISEKK